MLLPNPSGIVSLFVIAQRKAHVCLKEVSRTDRRGGTSNPELAKTTLFWAHAIVLSFCYSSLRPSQIIQIAFFRAYFLSKLYGCDCSTAARISTAPFTLVSDKNALSSSTTRMQSEAQRYFHAVSDNNDHSSSSVNVGFQTQ